MICSLIGGTFHAAEADRTRQLDESFALYESFVKLQCIASIVPVDKFSFSPKLTIDMRGKFCFDSDAENSSSYCTPYFTEIYCELYGLSYPGISDPFPQKQGSIPILLETIASHDAIIFIADKPN